MKNVLVLQTDNRDLDYLGLTKKLTKFTCKYMTENQTVFKGFNYNYLFVDMNLYKREKMNPCTTKIHVLNDALNTTISNTITTTTTEITKKTTTTQTFMTTYKHEETIEGSTDFEVPNVTTATETTKVEPLKTKITITNAKYDAIVFLDSDAWIQDFYNLHKLVLKLLKESPSLRSGEDQPAIEGKNEFIGKQIQGCYSRDPYIKRNTYINSGSFIIKVNDYTKNMYKTIMSELEKDSSHWDKHPYDQYYISKYVYENRNDFIIFKPPILNTPLGSVLRHNWWKTHQMYVDLYDLLGYFHTNNIQKGSPEIDFDEEIDNEVFPNTDENGYEYFH
jgi:hypothetical protein